MVPYYGDIHEDETIYMVWGSYDGGTGASITQTGLIAGDVKIFKDGGVAEKASSDGVTVNNDFDTRTGLHLISIDTSNDTGAAGFWVAQAEYQVAIDAVTIDAQTVRFWVGTFSIENRPADLTRINTVAQTATLDDIEAQTDDIGVAGAGLTAIPWNAAWDTEVESEVNDALVVLHLDHLLAVDYDPAAKPGVATALLNELVENDGGVSRFTGNAVENVWADVTRPNGADIAAILLDTAEIGTAGAGLSNIPWNASWDVEVESEVDDALVVRGLHFVLNTALPTSWTADVTANSALDYMADDGTAVFDRTTDSLQAIADSGGGGPTAAQIADAVWDEAQADHVAAGSFGLIASEIADILVDTAEIGSAGAGLTGIPWNAAWDAEVESEVDDALVARDLHFLLNTALPTSWTADVTANSALDYMADDGTAVFDRTTDSLQAIADSGGGGPTAAQIADAVWDELQADHLTVGSFGVIATEIADILTDTAEIGAAGAGLTAIPWNAAWDVEVESEVTDALVAAGLDHLVLFQGVSDAGGTTTTMVDAALTEIDDTWIGAMIVFLDGTDGNRCRLITEFVAGTDTITFAPAVSASVGAGVNYVILPHAGVDVQSWIGGEGGLNAPLGLSSGHVQVDVEEWQGSVVATPSVLGVPEVDLTHINGVAQTATLDDIEAQTDDIGVAGAGLTAIPWNAAWDAEVESEVNDALVVLGLDHLVSASVVGTDVVDNSIIARMVSKSATADWDSFANTNDSLEAVSDRLPAALVGGLMSSDVTAISTSTDAADKLEVSTVSMLIGTVDNTGFAPTTTEFECDDITEATADHFIGRIVIFTSGALIRQATDITDYSLATGRGHFTVTALTEAPANNDTLVII